MEQNKYALKSITAYLLSMITCFSTFSLSIYDFILLIFEIQKRKFKENHHEFIFRLKSNTLKPTYYFLSFSIVFFNSSKHENLKNSDSPNDEIILIKLIKILFKNSKYLKNIKIIKLARFLEYT